MTRHFRLSALLNPDVSPRRSRRPPRSISTVPRIPFGQFWEDRERPLGPAAETKCHASRLGHSSDCMPLRVYNTTWRILRGLRALCGGEKRGLVSLMLRVEGQVRSDLLERSGADSANPQQIGGVGEHRRLATDPQGVPRGLPIADNLVCRAWPDARKRGQLPPRCRVRIDPGEQPNRRARTLLDCEDRPQWYDGHYPDEQQEPWCRVFARSQLGGIALRFGGTDAPIRTGTARLLLVLSRTT